MTQSAILEKITSFAAERFPDSELFLFGSRAKKTEKLNSDWDVLLLLEEDTIDLAKEKSIMDEFYELELQTGVSISPLIYSKKIWNKTRPMTALYQEIKKDAIRLRCNL